jgi:hypothetical protein
LRDPSNHGGGPLLNLAGFDPQDLDAAGPQIIVTNRIVLDLIPLVVRRAIDLNAKANRGTIEVHDVRARRTLPSEAETDLVATEHGPQRPLRLRHVPAQFAGFSEHRW